MAIQSQFFTLTSDIREFPSTKHIAQKTFAAVWIKDIQGVYSQLSFDKWDLINNSVVFREPINTSLYTEVEIRVADSSGELVASPSDIVIVAGIADEIIIVAGIAPEVVTVAGIEQQIKDITSPPLEQAILDAEANANKAETEANKSEQSAIDSAQSAAEALASFNELIGTWYGVFPTDPTLDPLGNPITLGDVYYNSVEKELRIWNGTYWEPAVSRIKTIIAQYERVATDGQTVFGGLSYDPEMVQVAVDGILYYPTSYDASSGTEIVFNNPLSLNDNVLITAYTKMTVRDNLSHTITMRNSVQTRNGVTATGLDKLLHVTDGLLVSMAQGFNEGGQVDINEILAASTYTSTIGANKPDGYFWYRPSTSTTAATFSTTDHKVNNYDLTTQVGNSVLLATYSTNSLGNITNVVAAGPTPTTGALLINDKLYLSTTTHYEGV